MENSENFQLPEPVTLMDETKNGGLQNENNEL